ncbi:MAG: putative DNA binding domain-containing protein [Deltaproteobacteria bacterium]|nr:putative DNA binding domain-containing protein [Deltaproteobacteria bacterium]
MRAVRSTPQELEALLRDLETDRVERKASATDGVKIRDAICAYANDLPAHGKPGYVFIGAKDDGTHAGTKIDDNLLLTLGGMKDDGNIIPLPMMNVDRVMLFGQPIAVVEVFPSDAPPVRHKGQVRIRVGPRRAVASQQEERTLAERAVHGTLTFDRRPCRGASFPDLLLDDFQSYLRNVIDPATLAANHRTPQEQAASLRIVAPGTDTPTNAGIIAFGIDPESFIPGSYIQFVRYAGEDLGAPVKSNRRIAGNLATQLRFLDEVVMGNIDVARRQVPGSMQHEDKPTYPLGALREIVHNAIMHRTYDSTASPVRINWFDDRVEIQSPGGLYGNVTRDNYARMTDYRNPVIAEILKGLGYVDRFGVGIARTAKALRDNGNPPADFQFEPTTVLVTLRKGTS